MIKQILTSTIDGGKTNILATFNAVPEDKLNWKPLDNGRTALDLFGEAAQTASFVCKLVESRGESKPTREMFGQMREERAAWSREDALAALETNHAALIAAIEGCSDEGLAQPVTLMMGGGMTLPLAGWAMIAYRSYISRFAQINYIQTLYGDFEGH